MEVESNVEINTPLKRPKWVWAISIFYSFSIVSAIYSFYVIYSGSIPLNEVQKEYFESLNFIDMALTFVSSMLTLSAAITLFLLKKITIKLWAAIFVFSAFAHLYSAFTTNYIETLDQIGFSGIIFGTIIIVLIYFYTKRLDARGYLS